MRNVFFVLVFVICFIKPVMSETVDEDKQLKGKVNGLEVSIEKAVFADKILKIKTKTQDGFTANLSIHLPIEIGVIPALKKFSSDDNTFGNRVSVSYYWKDLSSGKNINEFMKNGEYTVHLEFGSENQDKIAGQLSLKNPGLDIDIEGRFLAEIKGLRLVDGHPDLQCDHRNALIYAGELYLQKTQKSPNIKISNVMDCKYPLKDGDKKAGWLEGEYKDGKSEPVFVRLQFIKNENGWEVFRRLNADQIIQAHPIVPFDVNNTQDDGELYKMLNFLTAKALEDDIQKQFPREGFSARIGLKFGFNPKTAIGYNSASYKLDRDNKWISKTYLFHRADGVWQLERALKDGEKVNTQTGQVETFVAAQGKTLCQAVEKGDEQLVKILLEKGADINAKDTKGIAPIIYAVGGGYENIAKMLIDRGCDVNVKANDGRIALFTAIARGDVQIVKALIEGKADVNIKNGHNSTALHTAAVWDRDQISEILINAGADVNVVDEPGNSPLDLAKWWGSEKTATCLEAKGGKIIKATKDIDFAGRICGMEMINAKSEIDRGKFLYLYSKTRYDIPSMTIFLDGIDGIVPIEKSFVVDQSNGEGNVNNISVKYSAETKGRQGHEWLGKKNYDLKLIFRDEKDGILKGNILLECPEKDIRIKGSFDTAIKGLRMVDGHPDLLSDAIETLRYAAKLYLQQKMGKDDIDVSSAKGNYSSWFGRVIGGTDVIYKLDDNSEQLLRVLLRKGKEGWKVVKELKGNQFYTAHPLDEVKKDDMSKYLQYLVWQQLEKDLQKEKPNANFRSSHFASTRISSKHGVAEVKVEYIIIDDNKDIHSKYLLRQGGEDWIVERKLKDNEKLNTKTGLIENN